jgi:alpha-beta hydrolase superfamily lysophospholipase
MAMHHPFTMPMEEDWDRIDTDPGSVRAKAYDIVLNGNEIGGGSVRIHQNDIQEKMFEVLGFTKEQAWEQFSFLLNAFRYGVPPHAGLAYGLDRLVMLMAGADTIRDVIAFPKVKDASCLMTEAPSPVAEKQLEELLPGFGGSVSDETQRGCWPQEKGTECLLTDVRNLFQMTIKEHETTPYFLFGEEEGSLLLQQYVTIFSDELNGVILSGANRLAPHHLRRLKWKARFAGTADGWHTRKETLTNAVFGSHLNREEQETISVGVCYEVLRQMEWVSRKPYLKRIANGLPFLLLGGTEEQESADALRTVYVIYLQNRIRDVVMRTYPGRDRDLLADPDAEEVREDVLAWLFARAARGR